MASKGESIAPERKKMMTAKRIFVPSKYLILPYGSVSWCLLIKAKVLKFLLFADHPFRSCCSLSCTGGQWADARQTEVGLVL